MVRWANNAKQASQQRAAERANNELEREKQKQKQEEKDKRRNKTKKRAAQKEQQKYSSKRRRRRRTEVIWRLILPSAWFASAGVQADNQKLASKWTKKPESKNKKNRIEKRALPAAGDKCIKPPCRPRIGHRDDDEGHSKIVWKIDFSYI